MHIYALAILVGLAAIASPALAADQEVLLDVSVNKHAIGKIGAFVLRDGALLSRRQELTDLGIHVPLAAAGGPDDLIALSALPGLAVAFDFAAQTVDLTAIDQSLLPSVLRSDAAGFTKGPVESGTGAAFDYDIIGTSAGTRRTGTGAFDFRAFSPWGVASSGALAYAGGGPAGPGSTSAIRLDSTYSLSDPDTLRHYKLGDLSMAD